MWMSKGTYIARILASLFGGIAIGLICCTFISLILIRRIRSLQSRIIILNNMLQSGDNREFVQGSASSPGTGIRDVHDESILGTLEEAGAVLESAYRATRSGIVFIMKPVGERLWVMKERARVELRDLLSTPPEALGAVRLNDEDVEPIMLNSGQGGNVMQREEKAGTGEGVRG